MDIKVGGNTAHAYGVAYVEEGTVSVSFSLPHAGVYHLVMTDASNKQTVYPIKDDIAVLRKLKKGAYRLEVVETMQDGSTNVYPCGTYRVRSLYDSVADKYMLEQVFTEATDRARLRALESRVEELEKALQTCTNMIHEIYKGYDPLGIGLGPKE